MTWTVYITILAIVSIPSHLTYRIERQAVTEAIEIEPTEAPEQEWPITQPLPIVTTPPAFGKPLNNVPTLRPQAGPNVVSRSGQAGPAPSPGVPVGGQPVPGVGSVAPARPAAPAAPAGEVEVETPEFEVTNPPATTRVGQTVGGYFDYIFGFNGPTTSGGFGLQNFYYQTTAGSVIDQSIAIAPGRPGLTGPIVIGDIYGVPNTPQQRENVVDVTAGRSRIGTGSQGQYYQGQPMGAPLSSTNSIIRSRINVPTGSNVGPSEYLQINTRPGPQYGQGQISARSDGVAVDYRGSIQGPVEVREPYSSNIQGVQQAGPSAPSNQRQSFVSNVNRLNVAQPAPQNVVPSFDPVQYIPQTSGTAYTNSNQNVIETAGYGPSNSVSGIDGGRQSSGPNSNNASASPNQGQMPDVSGNVAAVQRPQGAVAGNGATNQGQSVSIRQGYPAPRSPPQATGTAQTTNTNPQSNVVIQNPPANQVISTSQMPPLNQTSGNNQNSLTNPASGTTNSKASVEPYQGHWIFEASRTSSSGPGPIRGKWVFQTALGTPSGGPAPISGQWVFEPEVGAVRNGTDPIRGQWVFKSDQIQSNSNLATSGNVNATPLSQQLTTATLPENTVPPQGTGAAQPTVVSGGVPQANSQSAQGTSVGNVANIYEQPAPTVGYSVIQVQGQGSISVSNQMPLIGANLSSSVNQPGSVDILNVTTPMSVIATTAGVPSTIALTTPAPVTEPLEIEPTEPLEIEPTPAPDVPPAPAATVPPTTIPDAVQPASTASVIDQSIAIAPGRPGLTGPNPIVIRDVLGVPNTPQQRGNVVDITASRPDAAQPTNTVSAVGSAQQPSPTSGSTGQGNVVAVQPSDVAQVPNGSPQPRLTAGEVQPSNLPVVEQPPVNPNGRQQAVNPVPSQVAQVPISNSQSVTSASQTSTAYPPREPQVAVVWPQAGPVIP